MQIKTFFMRQGELDSCKIMCIYADSSLDQFLERFRRYYNDFFLERNVQIFKLTKLQANQLKPLLKDSFSSRPEGSGQDCGKYIEAAQVNDPHYTLMKDVKINVPKDYILIECRKSQKERFYLINEREGVRSEDIVECGRKNLSGGEETEIISVDSKSSEQGREGESWPEERKDRISFSPTSVS